MPVDRSLEQITAAMDVTVDDYDRIVIPKVIRERLGLESGSSLELDVNVSGEGSESITLRSEDRQYSV